MHDVVKWLHVLLFGAWLGSDYGTFLSSQFLLKADKSIETRLTAARMMLLFDLGPRIALVLMLPLGLTLADSLRITGFASYVVPGAWVLALAWLGLLVAVELGEHQPWRERLRRIDLGIRSIVAALALTAGVTSLVVEEGPFRASWLGWKVTIFGLIICSGIGIRLSIGPFTAAFGEIVASGSTPERETALRRALARTYPFVGSIWLMVLIAGYLGVAQP